MNLPQTPALDYRILGTAGHIDHGKSTLVRALTGSDPDRLPEEKRRGMTIELGFAHLDIDHLRFGVVDVPGHERFVRTMVSGATGIDLGILVVAADDGVMPQTREHAEILDLLGVQHGLIAVNKIDMVDSGRLELVSAELAELTHNTPLAKWPTVPVSAARGTGLDQLRKTIATLAATLPPRRQSSIFRLAIDRVFAVPGRGTVVTGSALCGVANKGDTLELQPGGLSCRVRETQSHGLDTSDIRAGQRAALNITGIDRHAITRGHELATPGYLTPTRHIDVRLRVLARRSKPLESFRRVRVAMGTWEFTATLVLLDHDAIAPGANGLAQLRLHQPVIAAYGQRFILREENAQGTIGGGHILRPVSKRLSRRQDGVAESLNLLDNGNPQTRLSAVMRDSGFEPVSEINLACRCGVEPIEIAAMQRSLRESGNLTSPIPVCEVHRDTLALLRRRALAYLQKHHQRHPREPGMPVERFCGWIDQRSRIGVGKWLLNKLIETRDAAVRGPYVAHCSFLPAISPEEERLLTGLRDELMSAHLDPPTWDKLTCVSGLPRARQTKLVELAKADPALIQIAPQHFAAGAAVDAFRATLADLGSGGRSFKLADVRDRLQLSRRAVQPFLEYFDRVQFTRRIGDERVLQSTTA